MSKDAKIGLLTLAFALSLVLLNSLREAGVVQFGSQLGLIFSQVHGLRAGDLVTIGGVPRGEVASIDFAPKEIQEALAPLTGGVTLVRAQVSFDTFREIPRESTYAVRSDLYGRRWIEITVSPSEAKIGPDEIFFAEGASRQDDQLQSTINTFGTLGKQTESLREVLSDPEFRLRTKDTASNLRFYSRELRAASAEAPEQLRAFEKNLDTQEQAILAQIKAFDDKTREVRRRMTEMSPQITENLKGWTERLSRQGDRLTTTLQMAVQRTEEYQGMLDKLIAENLNPESIQALIVQTRKWARKIEEYRYLAEDLHALTSDPTVRADLKEAISKLELRSQEINERLEKLEKRVDENPLKPILGLPDPTPSERPERARPEHSSSSEDPTPSDDSPWEEPPGTPPLSPSPADREGQVPR
jgi:ABC-type transporter Mla subunit MlaD